ncbi:uracil-DNA glycosylase-like [Corticium candelabrum]|uniref:uracil-DNA glycosylase-like n=1 Tax=Corticium candelabrum TaxID=121492 RepID=UPI002E2607E7|nr:uracil-DNA glycosylase-like [Corticium candelabrum]
MSRKQGKRSKSLTKQLPAKKTKHDNIKLASCLTDDAWHTKLQTEFSQPYFAEIEQFLAAEYAKGKEIFPPQDQIFNALNLTSFDKVKVVILGQDPYHDNGQAHGLSFSVPRGIKPPPSLKNIYKELEKDINGFVAPDHGCLEKWAQKGVLLLNATLTVEAHKANSHAKIGWQIFTDAIIRIINENCTGIVFILWGNFAQKKGKIIDTTKHKVINTAHPSPLSQTKFFNCKCFSAANDALKTFGKTPVDWKLS